MTARTIIASTFCLGVWLPVAGRAEEPATISVQGTASIDKPAEILRMRLDLPGSGPTMEAALGVIKQRRSRAVEALRKLGAVESSILGEGPYARKAQTEAMNPSRVVRMVNGRMVVSGVASEEEDDAPAKVDLVLSVRADWTLKGKDIDAILREVAEIQRRVKEADLATVPADKAESKSEKEEEDQADGQQKDRPTPPEWSFVCRISGEEQAKVTANALARARTAAERLATAAGGRIGGLLTLDSTVLPAPEGQRQTFASVFPNANTMRLVEFVQAGTPPADAEEAVSQDAYRVTWGVRVRAAYRLINP
jgi:hypothetical protein